MLGPSKSQAYSRALRCLRRKALFLEQVPPDELVVEVDAAAAALEVGVSEAAATATAVALVIWDDETAVVKVVAASDVWTAAVAEVAAADDAWVEEAVAVATAAEAEESEPDEPEQLKTDGPGTG